MPGTYYQSPVPHLIVSTFLNNYILKRTYYFRQGGYVTGAVCQSNSVSRTLITKKSNEPITSKLGVMIEPTNQNN